MGIISELHVRTRLAELGYAVYVPEGHGARADLVYEDPTTGELKKVQVKTGRLHNGCVVFSTCSVNGFTGKKTSYRGQIDEFMVWSPDLRKVYRLRVEEVGVSECALRVETARGGSKSNVRWAADYEF